MAVQVLALAVLLVFIEIVIFKLLAILAMPDDEPDASEKDD